LPTTQTPIRVLIVDDHKTVLWGLAKLVQSGHPETELVGAFTSGKEALAALSTHRPHIVLLDLELGSEHGLELLPGFREQAAVIVVTASRGVSPEQLVLKGARGVIHKSEPAEVILRAIARVHCGDTWVDRRTMSRMFNTITMQNASQSTALTPAERKVIAAVLQHKTEPNKVIADVLHISEHTLRNHLSKIYSKLDVRRRIDLILHAQEHYFDIGAVPSVGRRH
jgi:two-component system nitrate/nitrite response regulator NarL